MNLPPDATSPFRELRFEYTPEFPRVLEHLGASLLVSTYQASKLAVVGVEGGQLKFSFHMFEKATGVAVARERIAVATRKQIWMLHPSGDLAPSLDPPGTFDSAWLARSSQVTGETHTHELAWARDGLWMVNTRFSALCTLGEGYSFVPRWRPPFISALAAEDRCHLNGMAVQNGRPKVVSMMAETDEPSGWRENKATSGLLMDVDSGQTVTRGLCMPHSPRLAGGKLWVLDSGNGAICVVDPASGHRETVETFPGYTRGLSFAGQFAFVGLSKIRETSTFGGVPIAEKRHELRCGVGVVDLVTGRTVATLQFHSGVDEIFAVEVLPGSRRPYIGGPHPEADTQRDVWIVPPEGNVPQSPIATQVVGGSQVAGGSQVVGGSDGSQVAGGSDGSQVVSGSFDPPTQSTAGLNQAGGDLRSRVWDGQETAPQRREVSRPNRAASAKTFATRAAASHAQGDPVAAAELYRQAIALQPDQASWHCDLGNVWQDLNDQDRALECYREAVRLDPNLVAARQNLGYLLFNYGRAKEALEHYEHARRVDDSPMTRMLAASVLPVVYDSAEAVEAWRARLVGQVHKMAEDGVEIDTTKTLIPTSFFLAYQGQNDVDVARDLGRIYTGPVLCPAAGDGPLQPRSDGRLRIGFLSAYFRDHTIGRLNLGRIQRLDRQRFEVTVISAASTRDAMAGQFRRAADRFLAVPRNVARARRLIADQDLDVLIFADVGMDALTGTLAHSRMAPVQCVTWGHPDTTGSRHIDYFLSSELLETADAERHYTEQLVRLPLLGTYYERPQCGRSRETSGPNSHESGYGRSRESFGLDPARHSYLCPQTLFKFHPDFDVILAAILDADPNGEIALLEGRVPQWTQRLKARFERTLGKNHDRVRFLPARPRDAFLKLLAAADVIIDPPHFGGGNSTYEALAVGTPVVTVPSPYLRGRITQALYQRIGWTEMVVETVDEFVATAVRVATDAEYQQQAREQILQSCGILFENDDEVHALDDFLWSLASKTNPQTPPRKEEPATCP